MVTPVQDPGGHWESVGLVQGAIAREWMENIQILLRAHTLPAWCSPPRWCKGHSQIRYTLLVGVALYDHTPFVRSQVSASVQPIGALAR